MVLVPDLPLTSITEPPPQALREAVGTNLQGRGRHFEKPQHAIHLDGFIYSRDGPH